MEKELSRDEIIAQESDPEYMKKLATREIATLDVEKYQKWFEDSLKFFNDNHDKIIEKLKESYPKYYQYMIDSDIPSIDEFTDGLDLLITMSVSDNKAGIFLLGHQRKYVDATIERLKEILK